MAEEPNIEFSNLLPQYQNKENIYVSLERKHDIHGFSFD